MAQSSNLQWIDNWGNVYDGSTPIGYYEAGKCFDFDGNTLVCPDTSGQDIKPITVRANRTYWWAVLLVLVLGLFFYFKFIAKK